jgi:serine/tyrosine/threonine adenylyltransferase
MNFSDTWQLENSYTKLPGKFYTPVKPTPVSAPKLIIFNEKLANSLGIDLSYDDDEV